MIKTKQGISKREQLLELIPARKKIDLREEQLQCINAIMAEPPGSSMLAVMATGLGKTATFTHLPRGEKKTLIISAGEEIVLNPLAYYDCEVGVEMGEFRAKRDFPDAKVISASAQSLCNRLTDYDPGEFETVIVDEAHHSPARTYRACIDYFKPDRLVGFTATPKRTDGVRLDDIYSKIVFLRDLKWAIKNEKLCDVYSRKVQIDVDLRNCRTKQDAKDGETDFMAADLARAMAHSAPAIVDIYKQYAFGPTIVNVASVALAYEVAGLIPGAVAVTGEMNMKERDLILQAFRDGHVQCLVSVSVLKEGVDLPSTTTIIMARPTMSALLYTQIVGRGLRLYPGKKFLNLIDIEGILGENVSLCSAPTLYGIDMSAIPKPEQKMLNEKMLTDMEEIAEQAADKPESWSLNAKAVQTWADSSGYDMHSVNWYLMPDGHLELHMPKQDTGVRQKLYIPAPDALGRVTFGHTRMPVQIALDKSREFLDNHFSQDKRIWDLEEIRKGWGGGPASPKQLSLIRNLLPDMDTSPLTKQQASSIITRLHADRDNGEVLLLYPVSPDSIPAHYTAEEVVMMGREPFTIYDYDPGKRFPMNVKKKELATDFETWLTKCVERAYYQVGRDVDALIARINESKKVTYGVAFMRYMPKYRYVCALDKTNISRRDLSAWLGKLADVLIPQIIYSHILHAHEGLTTKQAKPDMKAEPFCRIVLDYPESLPQITGERAKRLPRAASEIKEQAMERWAEKEKKKAGELNLGGKEKAKAPVKMPAAAKRPRGRPKTQK